MKEQNNNDTLTRAEIIEAIYRDVGVSKKDASDALQFVLDEITTALTKNDTVKIATFGSFKTRLKNKRVGRNPKTGIEVDIDQRVVTTFKASNILKEKINSK